MEPIKETARRALATTRFGQRTGTQRAAQGVASCREVLVIEDFVGHRVVAEARHLAESEALADRQRGVHARGGLKTHRSVAYRASAVHDRGREQTLDLAPLVGRADIELAQFRDAVGDGAEAVAPVDGVAVGGQHDHDAGSFVGSGESVEFLLEPLVTQAVAEAGGVLAEDVSNVVHLGVFGGFERADRRVNFFARRISDETMRYHGKVVHCVFSLPLCFSHYNSCVDLYCAT